MPARDYPGNVLAICSEDSLRLWKVEEKIEHDHQEASQLDTDPGSSAPYRPNQSIGTVEVGKEVSAAAWNRNNKVIAVALNDGNVQLRYANGRFMNTLKGEEKTGGLENKVTALSWSMGSKTLAAGSLGMVQVYNMTTKTCSSHLLDDVLPVGLQHHPGDSFLAVAGRDISLYSLDMEEQLAICRNPVPNSLQIGSSFTSVSVAAAQPYIAAGTGKNGMVAVWNYETQKLLFCDKYRHSHKGPCKVAFAPLDPCLLYSVGADGILKMQDLRVRSSLNTATTLVNLQAGGTCLSIREETGQVAVGTSCGNVLVFPAGLISKKPEYIYESNGDNVQDICWQHSFFNLMNKSSGDGIQESQQSKLGLEPMGTRQTGGLLEHSTVSKGTVPSSDANNLAKNGVVQSLSNTDVPEYSKKSLLEKSNDVVGQFTSSKQSGSETSCDTPETSKTGNKSSWCIGTMANTSVDQNRSRKDTGPSATAGGHSKLKASLRVGADSTSRKQNPREDASGNELEYGGRQEILAMHLDMLNMFEDQQRNTQHLIDKVMERQDALSRELHMLQHQIRELLMKRTDTMWL